MPQRVWFIIRNKRSLRLEHFSSLLINNKAFVEENIPMICVARVFLRRPEKSLDSRLIHHLHILIVEKQPVIMALYKTNIMPVIWPTSNMNHHSKQRVLRVTILQCGAELQFQREHDTIRQLLVSIQLFHKFESLEMDDQDTRWFLYLHPFLGFLQTVFSFPKSAFFFIRME